MTNQNNFENDLKKLRKNKQFLTILILLFVVLFFWIFISLASSQTSERISPELTRLAIPLVPSFETEVIDRIQQKKSYTQQELSSFTIYKILSVGDGKTERIVPLEVSAKDLVPTQTTPTITDNQVENSEENEINDSSPLENLFE